MGLLDSVKDRLGVGGRRGGYDDYDDGYDDDYAGDAYYDDDGDYEDDGYYQGSGSPRVSERQPSRSFRVNRSGYKADDHAPLISLSDVRAQQAAEPSDTPRAVDTPAYYAPRSGSVTVRGGKAPLRTVGGTDFDRSSTRATGRSGALPRTGSTLTRHADSLAQTAQTPILGAGKRKLTVLRPMVYADAEQVANAVRAGDAAIIDLTGTRPEMAKRILDFSFGAASALGGKVDRAADRVFTITLGGGLDAGERAELHSKGIV
jgi:cell division inhibitor SepF